METNRMNIPKLEYKSIMNEFNLKRNVGVNGSNGLRITYGVLWNVSLNMYCLLVLYKLIS